MSVNSDVPVDSSTTPHNAGKADGHDPEKNTLTLTIWAPHHTEPRIFDWPKTMKVAEAALQAATDFGLAIPNMVKLQRDDEAGTILDPHKTLVAEHLKDGDSLTLIADGGGV